MKKITETADMQHLALKWKKKGCSTGFVPTMGALHEGHLSLIRTARKHHDYVVVSIFVNPLQFGPGEDYDSYPADLKGDVEKAEQAGADIVYAPSVKEMYPDTPALKMYVTEGMDVLCGRHRPGHFDGVVTVVMKLFQITQPDRAYFGQKDAQQAALIKKMAADFNLPVDIAVCRTIRERDGLAISSRNQNLTREERLHAPRLYESLQQAHALFLKGETDPAVLEAALHDYLQDAAGAAVEYAEVLSYPSLKGSLQDTKNVIFAAAVRFSRARLIDNLIVSADGKENGYV
ncbi:pantoate--beta-alanine ligase [Salibacterium sp. K-3]